MPCYALDQTRDSCGGYEWWWFSLPVAYPLKKKNEAISLIVKGLSVNL
jgi:hypothetical protein